MSRIVGVHGIGAQQMGQDALSVEWRNAIRGGLRKAGHSDLADQLKEDDVRVAHYGDLFFNASTMGGGTPTTSELSANERQMIRDFYEAGVARDPSLTPTAGAMGAVALPPVNIALQRLLTWPIFAGITQRLFLGNLRQVNRFLDEPSLKTRVFDRLDELMSADTRVVIGHSLGSIVSYEYLIARPPETAVMFLTIGSPLGMPNVIFDRLTPTPRDDEGAWPAKVSSWINVADPDDIVALVRKLEPKFAAPSDNAGVVDYEVNNEEQPHSAARYLVKTFVGETLASSL